jgi:hypothetical protein
MAKVAYFDGFSGASGDMILGALVDAGLELARLEAELRKLRLEGWGIVAERVRRGALHATQVKVSSTETHHPRNLSTIEGLIADAKLSPRAAEAALRIFRRLGAAEARVHGVPLEKVHFHEVGAVDAIMDIVGAAVGLELFGIEQVACAPLNVGSGKVMTAHGILPVPAPATVELLRNAPTYSSGIQRELVTPTGAAILSTLAAHFGAQPPMTAAAVGYGAGSAQLEEQPNVLRVVLGESAASVSIPWDEKIAVIEANLDDMNPQIYGYFAEKALAAGALDVYATPVQMKKGRPGQLLTILCCPAAGPALVELVFRETTTIGVRIWEAHRRILQRETVTVETALGAVRMKLSRQNGLVLNAAPEYEDCRRIAEERGVPLKEVLAAATAAYQKQKG